MTVFDELSVEYLQSVDWETPIRDVSPNICDSFYRHFFQAARSAEEHENTKEQLVFNLLGNVSSLYLKPDEKYVPFGPIATFGDRRSADIGDFTEEEIEILKLLTGILKEKDLIARLSDVIWVIQRKNNFRFAELAIDNYLLCGETQVFGDMYNYGIERLTRALRLTASLGRQSDRYSRVIQKIDSLVEPFLPKHNSPVSELIKLLLEHHAGDSQKLARSAELCAVDAETVSNWYVAGHYWEIKAQCHRVIKDVEQEYQALQRLAITYVKTAEDSIVQRRGHGIAARHIQSAIEVLRRSPDTKKQQEQLHKTMLDYQQKSLDEFGRIQSKPIDLTPEIENFISYIKDKDFLDAIIALALHINLVSKKNISAFVDEMVHKSPFLALISTNLINADGKIVGLRGSMFTGSEKEMSQAKEAEMFHQANMEQNARGAVIEHTRRYFLIEHNPSLRDFLEIVTHNPFTPPGREMIYAQGLLSGLQGDFVTALHLLIPQIENSIRYLLNRAGTVTSSLNSEGIQEEFDLNKLLDMPEAAEMFDEDIIFGLKGTLTSRFGGNFRNLLAHGLLEQGHFYSYTAVYIWWLILRFFCIPLMLGQEIADAPKEN
jgi:hypothetical protein